MIIMKRGIHTEVRESTGHNPFTFIYVMLRFGRSDHSTFFIWYAGLCVGCLEDLAGYLDHDVVAVVSSTFPHIGCTVRW